MVFSIQEVSDSFTYTLVGLNESGKSNFLKAISLFNKTSVSYPLDYYDQDQPVETNLIYLLDDLEKREILRNLAKKGFDEGLLSEIEIQEVNITARFESNSSGKRHLLQYIKFKKSIFPEYTLEGDLPIRKTNGDTQRDFKLSSYFIKHFSSYFINRIHNITFWEAKPQYLINDPIDLESFALNPKEVSIPLSNCFNLAGIKNIKNKLKQIKGNSTQAHNLQEHLGDEITKHIKKIWSNHPIRIKIQINDMMLSFLIEDEGVKYNSKSVIQRSDGFKQFISFILTISAQNKNNLLSNGIILVDEPEIHLHPGAQESLKNELINLTKNKNNNVLFFSTHSSYMIDKASINRCYKFYKLDNTLTSFEKMENEINTYAELNYEVFDIATNDYHNELYGHIEEKYPDRLNALDRDRPWNNLKSGKIEEVSLPKYIRNSIHHPENKSNEKFSYLDLTDSIYTLRNLKIQAGNQ